MVTAIILSAVAVLILTILLSPVIVKIKSAGDEIDLKYRYLFLSGGIGGDPDGFATRSAKKITGISKIENLSEMRQEYSSTSEILHQYVLIIKGLIDRVLWILKYCRVRPLDLTIKIGSGDAAAIATEYGAVCATVYPLLSLLDDTMKIKSHHIDIGCDFVSGDDTFYINTKIYIPITRVVQALFHIVVTNVRATLELESLKKQKPKDD